MQSIINANRETIMAYGAMQPPKIQSPPASAAVLSEHSNDMQEEVEQEKEVAPSDDGKTTSMKNFG